MVCEFCVLFAQESSLMLEEYGSELFILALYFFAMHWLGGYMKGIEMSFKGLRENHTNLIMEIRGVRDTLLNIQDSAEYLKSELTYLRPDPERTERREDDKRDLLVDQKEILQDTRNATEDVDRTLGLILSVLERNAPR